MTEENKTENTQTAFLKRFGLFLKEKGYTITPLQESTDSSETFLVNKNDLINICKLLKEDDSSSFDLLISVSAVDLIKDGLFESVYHLFSTKYLHKLTIKVQVPREKPVVPSVTEIWITADWHEREAYDLMGIQYSGHPDLKRILLPNDWIGHPLRKDYVLNDERLIWNER